MIDVKGEVLEACVGNISDEQTLSVLVACVLTVNILKNIRFFQWTHFKLQHFKTVLSLHRLLD